MSHKPFILYSNLFDSTTTATDTEASGDYNPAYVSDLRPYTFWKASAFGTKYLYIDAGATSTVDTLAILGHNFSTSSATVSVESSATGAWAGEETIRLTGFTVTTDRIIVKKITSASDRYWRVKMVTAAIAPTASVVMLGERLDFPIFPDTPFTIKNETINGEANVSRTGHLLGANIKYTPFKASATFTWPDYTFIDGDFETFWNTHGRLMKPFVWVPNITEWPSKAYFVRFPTGYNHKTTLQDTTNADNLILRMEGVIEDV